MRALTLFLFVLTFFSINQLHAANDFAPAYAGKVASDEITGVYIPKVKIQYGADGSATDVTTLNGLPVTCANCGGGGSSSSSVVTANQGTAGIYPWNMFISSSALPSGASTEATLLTVSQKATNIDNKLGSLGQKTMAGSAPMVLASDQSAIPVSQSGAFNVTNISGTVSLPTGASTLVGQTTGNASLSSIDGKLSSLGQKAMTASTPVVLSSDQSAIPVSQSGAFNVTNISGTVSLPTGAATATNQVSSNAYLTSINDKITSTPVGVRVDNLHQATQWVDQYPLIDTASTSILATSARTVVASATQGYRRVRVADTTGRFITVFANGTRKFIVNPGMDQVVDASFTAGDAISVQAADGSTVSNGTLLLEFQF